MKPLKKASRVVMSDVVDLAEAGARIIAGWPEAFFAVLNHCRQDARTPGGLSSMNDALPGLTRRMTKLRDERWRERIAKALGVYVAASHQSGSPIVGRNVLGARHPAVAQIARDLGMRSTSLVAALDRLPVELVAMRTTVRGRSRRLVSTEAIQQVQRLRLDELSIKAVARLTGLSPGRIVQLIDAGLLAKHTHRLSREAVVGLTQSFLAAGRSNTLDTDAISLRRALRYCVPVCWTSQLIRSVLDGSLIVFVPKGVKLLAEAMISEARCREWVAHLKLADGGGLTIPECAELLHFKQEVVYHLVRVGLLPVHTVKVGRRRTARMTTLEAVEHFKRKYAALVHLADDAGMNHRSALSWAKAQGIALVSGPSIDGGRQYFALRPLLNGSNP
ncbi:hypothetical protein [Roseateles microcysteis]|uniref:hypothetical protein n=1 Tax=Roseateles microcysteis TaxID=3119057 RepID=UPI002FE6AF56